MMTSTSGTLIGTKTSANGKLPKTWGLTSIHQNKKYRPSSDPTVTRYSLRLTDYFQTWVVSTSTAQRRRAKRNAMVVKSGPSQNSFLHRSTRVKTSSLFRYQRLVMYSTSLHAEKTSVVIKVISTSSWRLSLHTSALLMLSLTLSMNAQVRMYLLHLPSVMERQHVS